MMERPSTTGSIHPDNSSNIAGTFDLVSRNWTHIGSTTAVFCGGQSVMSNGSVITMGGDKAPVGAKFQDGRYGIRIYSPGSVSLNLAGNMSFPRWYPSVTLLPNQKIMVMGGIQLTGNITKYYEIWVRTRRWRLIYPCVHRHTYVIFIYYSSRSMVVPIIMMLNTCIPAELQDPQNPGTTESILVEPSYRLVLNDN